MKVKKKFDSPDDAHSYALTETPLINPRCQAAKVFDAMLGFSSDPVRLKALKEDLVPFFVLGEWAGVMEDFHTLIDQKTVLLASTQMLMGGPPDEVLERNFLPPLEGTAAGFTDAASFDHPLSIVKRICEQAHASSDPQAAFRTLKPEADAMYRAYKEIAEVECGVEDLILATESMKQLYADTLCKFIKHYNLTNAKSEKRAIVRDHVKGSAILGAPNGQIVVDMLPEYLKEPLAQYSNNLFKEGCALVFSKLVSSFHSKDGGAVAKAAAEGLAAKRRAVTDRAKALLKGGVS